MLKRTLRLPTFLIITSLFLYACGSEEEIGNNEEIVIEDSEDLLTNNESDILLPSPLQIAELFKNAGLTYIGDLTNSKDNVSKLSTKYDQKLNYGVYSADMAYCLMNNQTQESINYFKALKDLSEKLWMADILNSMGLSDRLEANIGNEDSLTYIMADMQMQMDDYLDENGMSYTGSIIFAGAWVETMYLGVRVNKSKKNAALISRLSEQSIVLDGLISSIKRSDEDNEFTELISDLEQINKHFDIFNEETEEEYILPDDVLENLSNDIIALRTKIIGE